MHVCVCKYIIYYYILCTFMLYIQLCFFFSFFILFIEKRPQNAFAFANANASAKCISFGSVYIAE